MTCLLVTMLEINNKEQGVDYSIERLAYFCSCGGSKASPHPQPGVHLTCNSHVFLAWHFQQLQLWIPDKTNSTSIKEKLIGKHEGS